MKDFDLILRKVVGRVWVIEMDFFWFGEFCGSCQRLI